MKGKGEQSYTTFHWVNEWVDIISAVFSKRYMWVDFTVSRAQFSYNTENGTAEFTFILWGLGFRVISEVPTSMASGSAWAAVRDSQPMAAPVGSAWDFYETNPVMKIQHEDLDGADPEL